MFLERKCLNLYTFSLSKMIKWTVIDHNRIRGVFTLTFFWIEQETMIPFTTKHYKPSLDEGLCLGCIRK